MWLRHLGAILTALTFISCNTTTTTFVTSNRISPTYAGPAELSYGVTQSYSGSTITLSGTATYNARQIYTTGIGGLGSANPSATSHPAANRPIRYAEVRITDSSGTLVQSTETLADGTFSAIVPQANTTYTISVNSRGDNSHIKASVLNSPEFNSFYSITTTASGLSSSSSLTLTALANGDIVGGAFNIFDQFVNANEYLRTQVGNCTGTFSGCRNFTVAPKVSAYWTKGFNPGSYYNSGPVSFYVRGYSRIFILGGQNGDTDSSDTDHFDNSVIIHEYGHFLEDAYFVSDSPGGTHSGNKIIDPRLAWSEGWGNFIQAAVRNVASYQDSSGNVDGSTALFFDLDIENATAGNDVPNASGEGNFREFSISRFLWDAIDDTTSETVHSASDNIKNGFKQIWASLTKTSNGWLNTALSFHNVGHLHLAQVWLQNNDPSGEDWSNIRTIEYHQPDTRDYARPVVATSGVTCADFTLTPANVSGDTGSFSTSDLFRNNKFYHLKISSPTDVSIQLTYEDADHAGTLADLDLYLYNESARYGNSSDILASSLNDPGSVSAIQTETVATTLSAGNYLINVMVFTKYSIGGTVNYKLKLNGVQLCPTTL